MPKHNQSLANKLGEVAFRKKLVRQHTGREIVSPGEPSFTEKLAEMETRIEKSQTIFQKLRDRGITLSPFLEIAAGEGYRSDFLVSKFGATGFATDISADTLAADRIIRKELRLAKSSIKICCDAYNLPFLSNSFPFVFVALSLHHFPDPTPVIKEAVRVLSPNGYFYFDEEPIKQGLNLNLWRRDYHLRWFEKILKYTLVLLFLSRIGKSEVEHGILEETFPLDTWGSALAIFEDAEVYETVFPFSWSVKLHKNNRSNWIFPNWLVRFGLFLFGGGIRGMGRVNKSGMVQKFTTLFNLLACPACRKGDRLTKLKLVNRHLRCPSCRVEYRQEANVWILLTPSLHQRLYGKKT